MQKLKNILKTIIDVILLGIPGAVAKSVMKDPQIQKSAMRMRQSIDDFQKLVKQKQQYMKKHGIL